MPEEFADNNSHEDNVKISIDKILGSETTFKRIKKNVEDQRKALFISFIDAMTQLDLRTESLNRSFMMDMTKYDTPFYVAIDLLMELLFSKTQIELIFFYLYDRKFPDGKVVEWVDQDGKAVDISSVDKFYEFLKTVS